MQGDQFSWTNPCPSATDSIIAKKTTSQGPCCVSFAHIIEFYRFKHSLTIAHSRLHCTERSHLVFNALQVELTLEKSIPTSKMWLSTTIQFESNLHFAVSTCKHTVKVLKGSDQHRQQVFVAPEQVPVEVILARLRLFERCRDTLRLLLLSLVQAFQYTLQPLISLPLALVTMAVSGIKWPLSLGSHALWARHRWYCGRNTWHFRTRSREPDGCLLHISVGFHAWDLDRPCLPSSIPWCRHLMPCSNVQVHLSPNLERSPLITPQGSSFQLKSFWQPSHQGLKECNQMIGQGFAWKTGIASSGDSN